MSDRGEISVLAKKRELKRLKRLHIKRLREEKRFPQGEYRPYRSPILDLFCASRASRGSLKKLAPKTFKAPPVFSVSRNAAECIEFFREIVEYSRGARRPRIVIDHRAISYLGLGADSVLGVLLYEIKRELRFCVGAFIRGYKPRLKHLQALMDEVGSVRVLRMDVEQDVRVSFTTRAMVYRHRHRPSDEGMSGANNHPASEIIADFSDHLDRCLRSIDRSLSTDGRDRICHYAGEIIDNVKEHAGLGEWAIVGYSDLDSDPQMYRCVIFCFGKTIAQTFLELPEDAYPRRIISPYIATHRGGGLFSSQWREEDLTTLIALQGDVSSKNVDGSSDRGQGTVELIQFFQGVIDECGLINQASGSFVAPRSNLKAEMNIISGSTKIRFDGEYRMQFREDLNRDVIAFNKMNDLFSRPDPKAVISLGEIFFPGTLVTIEIPLVGTAIISDTEVAHEN